MGVYGLAWTPAFIFKVIWTPVPNFWSMGPLAPQNLTILVSMELPGSQQSFEGNLDPRAKFLIQGPFGPKYKNVPFSHTTQAMGKTKPMLEVIWTLLPNFWFNGPWA